MNNNLLIKALDILAKAISITAYHAVKGEDKYQIDELLQEYQSLNTQNCQSPSRREQLIAVIDATVEQAQTLGAEEIADAIIEAGL